MSGGRCRDREWCEESRSIGLAVTEALLDLFQQELYIHREIEGIEEEWRFYH